jgi:hypothetical protein
VRHSEIVKEELAVNSQPKIKSTFIRTAQPTSAPSARPPRPKVQPETLLQRFARPQPQSAPPAGQPAARRGFVRHSPPPATAPPPAETPQRVSNIRQRLQSAPPAAAAEPPDDDEQPWGEDAAGMEIVPAGTSLAPPLPDDGEPAGSDAAWIRVNQDQKCFRIERLELDLPPGEAIFEAHSVDYERIRWEGDTIAERYRFNYGRWPKRSELQPPEPPPGVRDVWQKSARLAMVAPENGEPFEFLSSGKWGWAMVVRLARMARKREEFPGANPVIRLDMRDGKLKAGQRPYVIPVFTILGWTLPDGTEIDP